VSNSDSNNSASNRTATNIQPLTGSNAVIDPLLAQNAIGNGLVTKQVSQGPREKLLITGDDVLIEYVHRLMIAVQSIKEVILKQQWKTQIEKFIKHYVWHTSDVRRAANNKLW
jgi:hypothetical protein